MASAEVLDANQITELVGAVVNLDTPAYGPQDLVVTFALSLPPLCAGDCHGDGG